MDAGRVDAGSDREPPMRTLPDLFHVPQSLRLEMPSPSDPIRVARRDFAAAGRERMRAALATGQCDVVAREGGVWLPDELARLVNEVGSEAGRACIRTQPALAIDDNRLRAAARLEPHGAYDRLRVPPEVRVARAEAALLAASERPRPEQVQALAVLALAIVDDHPHLRAERLEEIRRQLRVLDPSRVWDRLVALRLITDTSSGAYSTHPDLSDQGRAAYAELRRTAAGTPELAIARIAVLRALHRAPGERGRGPERFAHAHMRALRARRDGDVAALAREARFLRAAGGEAAVWGHAYRAIVLQERGATAAAESELERIAHWPFADAPSARTPEDQLQDFAAFYLATHRSQAGRCDEADHYWRMWTPSFSCGNAATGAAAQVSRMQADCRAR